MSAIRTPPFCFARAASKSSFGSAGILVFIPDGSNPWRYCGKRIVHAYSPPGTVWTPGSICPICHCGEDVEFPSRVVFTLSFGSNVVLGLHIFATQKHIVIQVPFSL